MKINFMAAINVSVPKPCNENWNYMTEVECGRFCNVCSKVVIDFTSITTDEVKNYFLTHKLQKTCGHFKSAQIQKDYSRFQKYLINAYNRVESKANSGFLKFAYLILISCILTLTGCGGTMGSVDITGDTINNVQETDTTANQQSDTSGQIILHDTSKAEIHLSK